MDKVIAPFDEKHLTTDWVYDGLLDYNTVTTAYGVLTKYEDFPYLMTIENNVLRFRQLTDDGDKGYYNAQAFMVFIEGYVAELNVDNDQPHNIAVTVDSYLGADGRQVVAQFFFEENPNFNE